MEKNAEKQELLNELYNLILDKHIRDWERKQLIDMKNNLVNQERFTDELSRLEISLRPLALRHNLTPKMTDFYEKITSSKLFGRGVGGIF
ncbi:bacteriocin immunity protein [Lactococcus allomyrinae]|uniref:Bacteriocin immunity protein n=1 Tax=Lactococcus allomyrinae TaxID=2419773 RepID=A0A387B8I4_9LACT|nr:bacteriocin immunity protein [Lactococcus allomyrinae]AYG00003.1 bacteriocin immunity protein [Lactococcus allomyrinae]